MPITVAFLTGNVKKAEEYAAQMKKYNRAVRILPYCEADPEYLLQIESYLKTAAPKHRYVLRESSDLFVADNWEKGVERVSSKKVSGERVYNVSKLTIYSLDHSGQLSCATHRRQIEGHIDLSLRKRGDDGLWWDDIFVAARSRASLNQERELWGKNAARQLVLGQFICDSVVKEKPVKSSQPVDFAPALSAVALLRGNEFVQMARLDRCPWGLGNLLTNATNDGVVLTRPTSNRFSNYFSPGISGIPLRDKPDPFWLITYLIHDFFHQLIPDQIFSGLHSDEHRNVYVAARLMSEGLTIIPADMLFVEAVKAAGFDYDYSTRKINPLFGSLTLPAGSKTEQLKALLKANIAFCNLGDESYYRGMLTPGSEAALSDYTETYKHFFVPDLLWSAGNYNDMAARKNDFAAWTEMLGRDLFSRAKLPLLDDLVQTLKASGADLSSYESCVFPVFEHLFKKVLAPKLKHVEPVSDEQAQSNAFLRYMIGQSFMYAVYRQVPGMMERGKRMIAELRNTSLFTQDDITRLRARYRMDLTHLYDGGYITLDDLWLYKQIFPLFSPQYLSYDFDKAVCNSIPEAIDAAFGTV